MNQSSDGGPGLGNVSSSNSTVPQMSCPVVELNAASFVIPVTLLIGLDLLVIIGNGLVIAAILTQPKMRSVTNVFITSLAVSDLLLGITVLPFSSANEVLGYWPFGGPLCSAWLAVDVWLCTASILNLCAISVDRFLAVSRPIRYPSLMTPLAARLLAVSVWILSFAIAIPPLAGWNGRTVAEGNATAGNDSATEGHGRLETGVETVVFDCELLTPRCALASESSYIIYSALGSFWVPMLLMVFFYFRIYRTAILATDTLRKGVLATKPPSGTSSTATDTSAAPGGKDADLSIRVHRGGSSIGSPAPKPLSGSSVPGLIPSKCFQSGVRRPVQVKPLSLGVTSSTTGIDDQSVDARSSSTRSPSGLKSVFQIRTQLRRLNREKKAAKTVGVVVGCFVVCWAPFFTVYPLGAFCRDCTPGWVFAVFFWLGYCNSAINPLLYGLCSMEFRNAFRRLLSCRRRRRIIGSRIPRRSSPASSRTM